MEYEKFSERVFNGEPIDWTYWAGLKNITPHQAAKLANRINPIKWLSNNCALGAIPEETRINIAKLEQQIENQKATWNLQELIQLLGINWPEGMLEQVSIQNDDLTELEIPTKNLSSRKERDLTKWMRETWLKEGKIGGSSFFNGLKKYVNKEGSPIVEHYTTGKNGAGIRWNTGNATNNMAKKTIQTKVSRFKKDL